MSLKDTALLIKNETVENANTALRVGGLLEKMLTETVVRVDDKSALPDAVAGVITLEADTTYFIVGLVDLFGDRLVGSSNTCIIGTSSENSIISSNGLGAGVPLFSTAFTTPIRHVAFKDVDTALFIDSNGNNGEYDWTGVNIVNVPNIGRFVDFSNLILSKCAFVNSSNLILAGTFNTFSIDNSLFTGNGLAGNLIKLEDTCVIQRRFRIVYSSIVAFGATNGINVDALATIPTEAFILDTINFSGGGNYLVGIDDMSNDSLFINNVGITNTRKVSQYYMENNVIPTPITTVDVPVKVLGVTVNGSLTNKFVNTDNRATFTGEIERIFKATATLSLTAGNNNLVGCYLAKNGVILNDSEVYTTASGSGRAQGVTIQTLVELQNNDYIEIFVENKTNTTDIIVTDLNAIIF